MARLTEVCGIALKPAAGDGQVVRALDGCTGFRVVTGASPLPASLNQSLWSIAAPLASVRCISFQL